MLHFVGHFFLHYTCDHKLRLNVIVLNFKPGPVSYSAGLQFLPKLEQNTISLCASVPSVVRFDNPAAAAGWPSRQLTYSYLVAVNAGLLAAPEPLCCDWTMGTVPLVTSVGDPRNLGPLLVLAVIGRLLWGALASTDRRSDAVIVVSWWTDSVIQCAVHVFNWSASG